MYARKCRAQRRSTSLVCLPLRLATRVIADRHQNIQDWVYCIFVFPPPFTHCPFAANIGVAWTDAWIGIWLFIVFGAHSNSCADLIITRTEQGQYLLVAHGVPQHPPREIQPLQLHSLVDLGHSAQSFNCAHGGLLTALYEPRSVVIYFYLCKLSLLVLA